MNKIPKVCYAYWGNTCLPYLRYMCFKSFLDMNPDWRMVLYVPIQLTLTQSWGTFENKQVVDTQDYSSRLLTMDRMEIRHFDMESIGHSNHLPEVTKSDILRLHLLSTVGGLWTDSDIIYFRPLSHCLPDGPYESVFCYQRGGPTQEDIPKNGPKYHSIGFLAAAPESADFKALWEFLPKTVDMNNYQAMGSPYYGTIITEQRIKARRNVLWNCSINNVYPSRAVPGMWDAAQQYIPQIWDDCIGWHHYCGHPKSGEMQNAVTEQTCPNFDNVICWIVNRINKGLPVDRHQTYP